ncbi:hypothetical protein JTE90_004468 [Oedothorax gibbosus]|uniref:Uncharacterized protein n=1 Tax=Oedothorax gibbosus TaxID=931172 RepID=A0AAV6THC0_9ARAC|nr:hypothetical protein JTE90_004468 [Oedothorax gibbosus]
MSIDELNRKLDAYLEHDVLTLRCRVWEENGSVSEPPVDCFAKTEIKIAQLNYRWILEDLMGPDGILKHKFKRSTGILNFSSGFPTIRIHVSTGETFDDDSIYLGSKEYNGSSTPLFSVCNIHLLDSYGSIVHSICGEAEFQNSNETWKFPFLAKHKLLSNTELYLPGGKLTLQCELSFSGDLVVNCVEFGKTDKEIFNSEKPNEDSVSDGQELWKENMRQFYSDGEFSDLLVRTPNREFPVHRAILCAQSEVFRGMLSHDMKEKNSGVIEINDFEDDTVSKLLLYLYTNSLSLDDIDYVLAKDLYFAADKYRITPLQKICSNHLIESIDSSNACDILLLAEQLRDLELKATARNLIASSPYEIMNSVTRNSRKEHLLY